MSRGIRSGAIAPGTRLPTVREVARELKVSPATVSQAWRALTNSGAIVPRGRAGTFVSAAHDDRPRSRYRRLHPHSDARFVVDLSGGTPDPALLPDVATALAAVAGGDLASDYLGEAVLPELENAMRASWPYAPERIAVMDGAMDAIDRLLDARIRLGDKVIVEDPCFPPFLDMLTGIGAVPIGVGLDERGMLPDRLAVAVRDHSPVAVILQPRANNPTGASMTAQRCRALAKALNGSGVLVIEDDHAVDIARAPDLSVGAIMPDQVVHVRSYSKSHGADLRLSVVGGPAAILDDVVERRLLGPGWTSRLLQRILLSMLADKTAVDTVRRARDQYTRRSRSLRKALAGQGIQLPDADGINMWLPVADERAAIVALAASGIKAAPGGPFRVADLPADGDHVRVTVSTLRDTDLPWVAAELAAAAAVAPAYRRRRS